VEAAPACYDIVINPGEEVIAGAGTVAIVFATRNCP